jgi:hypothetical protein
VSASALAERAACAALYWARRKDGEAIRGTVAGLSETDLAEVRRLLETRALGEPSDDELVARMLDLGAKARGPEHMILDPERKTVATIAAPPAGLTDNGSFTGYLAAYDRDHGGDTILPGAMDETAAALNSGRIAWHLTDAHSEKASDVVATVTAAAIDHHGLRIAGTWMPTERAQALRQMVKSGAKLGLSIDYLTDASRPDGRGGRYLEKITVVGDAEANERRRGYHRGQGRGMGAGCGRVHRRACARRARRAERPPAPGRGPVARCGVLATAGPVRPCDLAGTHPERGGGEGPP